MKNTYLSYLLIVSIVCQCHTAYSMEEITVQKIGMIACLAAACGMSWYIMSTYNYPLLNLLPFFKNNSPSPNSTSENVSTSSTQLNQSSTPKHQTPITQELLKKFQKQQKLQAAAEQETPISRLFKACEKNDYATVQKLLKEDNEVIMHALIQHTSIEQDTIDRTLDKQVATMYYDNPGSPADYYLKSEQEKNKDKSSLQLLLKNRDSDV